MRTPRSSVGAGMPDATPRRAGLVRRTLSRPRVAIALVIGLLLHGGLFIQAAYAVAVTVTMPDIAITEGSPGDPAVSAVFTLTATPAPAMGDIVTLTVKTVNGTAIAPGDYTAVPPTTQVTLTDTDPVATVTVPIVSDDDDELDETFSLSVLSASQTGGEPVFFDAEAVATILDDDEPKPEISIGDADVAEGDSGTNQAEFLVTLSFPTGKTVEVDYRTANGTAVDPGDYDGKSGSLTFAPGDTSKVIRVDVKGDRIDEDDEEFFVDLFDPDDAFILDSRGTATIHDDDDPIPSLSVASADVSEGDSGTREAEFVVTLSTEEDVITGASGGAAGKTVTVHYETTNGSAVEPADYEKKSGTLTFEPSETRKVVRVEVEGDELDEQDEFFHLNLFDADNATIDQSHAFGFIHDDDDPTPVIFADNAEAVEGDCGTNAMVFHVFLRVGESGFDSNSFGATGKTVFVDYRIADGTAHAPFDFAPLSGTLQFSPGQEHQTVVVAVRADFADEGDESLALLLSNPRNAFIGRAQALGTIIDDDSAAPEEAAVEPALPAPGEDGSITPASVPSGTGYFLGAADGGVFTFGDMPLCGSQQRVNSINPVVGIAATPSGGGYWLVASDGGIFTGGSAGFFGSTGAIKLVRPIVGMAATATGLGYWLVASDGGVFAFGDAEFFGSTGGFGLAQPIVGMAATPTGQGYWLVASDGGIFAFGDAEFLGSTGNLGLARPIVGMAATPTGQGYWLVASDGGIFAFGDAEFMGSTGSLPLASPIVGMSPIASGRGYWLVASDGGIFAFGEAPFRGSTANLKLNRPIIGIAGF